MDVGGLAVFVSKAFDTRTRDTDWHRAVLCLEKAQDVRLTLSFYASNTKRVRLKDGTLCDLDRFIGNSLLSPEEKTQMLSDAEFWGEPYACAHDILLWELTGRYLWVKLEVQGDLFPKILHFRLYYPRHTFLRYLPESYQSGTGDFYARFAALFQSLYLDLDEKIESFHSRLNPASAPPQDLSLLAEWMGLGDFLPLPDPALRKLVAHAAELYPIWGTKASLVQVLELLCGQTPFVREESEPNPFSFSVLLPEAEDIDVKSVRKAIETIKPAHTSYTLVFLKQALILDAHTYLGVNSRLVRYSPPCLDEKTTLGIHALDNPAEVRD